jgi:hypothetical protein
MEEGLEDSLVGKEEGPQAGPRQQQQKRDRKKDLEGSSPEGISPTWRQIFSLAYGWTCRMQQSNSVRAGIERKRTDGEVQSRTMSQKGSFEESGTYLLFAILGAGFFFF